MRIVSMRIQKATEAKIRFGDRRKLFAQRGGYDNRMATMAKIVGHHNETFSVEALAHAAVESRWPGLVDRRDENPPGICRKAVYPCHQ